MIAWRAWYADAREYRSRDVSVDALPRDGLQIVMVYLADGCREIKHGEYLWWDGAWHTAVTREEIPAGALVFPGSMMPDPEFEWLQREAFAAVEP